MKKEWFGIWYKYQLSLKWFNILFRYYVKLQLVIIFIFIVFVVTQEFKSAVGQFKFFIAGLLMADLFLKLILKKDRQDLQAFHVIPNGLNFLSILNVLLDIFSARNLILPVVTLIIMTILGQQGHSPLLFILFSCFNNIVAGFVNREKKIISIAIATALVLVTSYFNLSIISISIIISLAFLLLIYQRYGEKLFPEENSLNLHHYKSTYSIGNPSLWLDFQILKRSRRLQLKFITVIGFCFVYGYIINTRYLHQVELDFVLITVIQMYYSFAPASIIPYILSSNYSHIGLIMTMPDLKSFFVTKFNIILIFQFLLTIILYGTNYSNVQTLLLISSIFIFNVFIITPIMFIGILLTDEKVEIFGSLANSFFIYPFVQSMYLMAVLVCVTVIFYLLQNFGLYYFSLTLIGLSILAFFQKERFFKFFQSQYYSKKYKIFKILS